MRSLKKSEWLIIGIGLAGISSPFVFKTQSSQPGDQLPEPKLSAMAEERQLANLPAVEASPSDNTQATPPSVQSAYSSSEPTSSTYYGASAPSSYGSSGETYVHGYTKKNGTYVAGHYKSSPDSSKSNNWSSKGNSNPHTGSRGRR